MSKHEILRDKTLALFFTAGMSLKAWYDVGNIDREVAIYNKLSRYFKQIYFFTYGSQEDLKFKDYLAGNITIVPKKYIANNLLYSLLLPIIHYQTLKKAHLLKTNQMWGSWSAIIAKLLYRKRLIVRTGYVLSISFKSRHPKSRIQWIMKIIERAAYRLADGIITSSQAGFDYVAKNYRPRCPHVLIPNYVETEVFRPMNAPKREGSICFVGKLTRQKNLPTLITALKGLPCTLSIIGSGVQREELEQAAANSGVRVDFMGNVSNHKLPGVLNEHELFVLPSLWEGMPKTLLEAMACGLPVIGTMINGTAEVINHGENGLLCDTDPDSIREAIIMLSADRELKRKLGENARRTIVENYSLDYLMEKELQLMAETV